MNSRPTNKPFSPLFQQKLRIYNFNAQQRLLFGCCAAKGQQLVKRATRSQQHKALAPALKSVDVLEISIEPKSLMWTKERTEQFWRCHTAEYIFASEPAVFGI